jgi:hypothetical protein
LLGSSLDEKVPRTADIDGFRELRLIMRGWGQNTGKVHDHIHARYAARDRVRVTYVAPVPTDFLTQLAGFTLVGWGGQIEAMDIMSLPKKLV